ncbi:hypothetical protein RCL1_001574 [Eukaryota sp. TZLM3-RCL]
MPDLRIAFLHPDLGLGGAERLVVDAAAGLVDRNHQVAFWTSFFDPNRCFDELKNIPVHVHGNWFPRCFFNKFFALCAYLRTFLTTITFIFHFLLPKNKSERPHLVFVDQVAVVVPLLRLFRYKVLFYCHFPDKLLAPDAGKSLSQKSGLSIQNIERSQFFITKFLRKFYRFPLNLAEEVSTGCANTILVNSNYTKKVFKVAFPHLKVEPSVLYPAVRLQSFLIDNEDDCEPIEGITSSDCIILSVNRFEKKKNIPLALEAFKSLQSLISFSIYKNIKLVLAGGYDPRVSENVQVFNYLQDLVKQFNLEDRVVFVPSFSRKQHLSLLKMARNGLLVYTPSNEHFGIVPIESMAAMVPVVAVNSGGPTESVVDGGTGYLCDPTPESFAQAMAKILTQKEVGKRFGELGRQRAVTMFGLDAFSKALEHYCIETVTCNRNVDKKD